LRGEADENSAENPIWHFSERILDLFLTKSKDFLNSLSEFRDGLFGIFLPGKLNVDNDLPETTIDLFVSAASTSAFYTALDRRNIETVFFAENSFATLSSTEAAA
jgi:hypothetical protein